MKTGFWQQISTKELAWGGLIAALYAILTVVFAPISFGSVQFRVSEALTLLPVMSTSGIPGLFIGCLLSSLICGAPWQDVIIGSLATLLAAVLTRTFRKNLWLAAFMPVLCNGLMVGAMLSVLYGLPFWLSVGTVALGEAAVCYMLGLPLLHSLQKRFNKL